MAVSPTLRGERALLAAYMLLLPIMRSGLPWNIQWVDLVFVVILGIFIGRGGLRRLSVIPLDGLVLAYVVSCAVSLINAPLIAAGFIGLMKVGSLAALYLVFGALFKDPDMRQAAVRWFIVGTLAVSGIGVILWWATVLWKFPAPWLGSDLMTPYVGKVLRLTVTFPTPQFLGNYLVMALPFVIGLVAWRLAPRWRAWGALGIAAVVVAELCTFTHSVAGFLAAAAFSLPRQWGGRLWMWARRILLVSVVGLFVVFNALLIWYLRDLSVSAETVPVDARLVPRQVVTLQGWSRLHVTATYAPVVYARLKQLAWEAFLEHPVVGMGQGLFHERAERAYRAGRIDENHRHAAQSVSHEVGDPAANQAVAQHDRAE